MATSIPNFKKRKSFISITRKSSICNQSLLCEQESCEKLPLEPEWKSLILNNSID